MTPFLEVDNLSRNFGAFEAVSGLSFSMRAGEKLAIIGPNGAGKSTCFNLIGGQLKPSAGAIRLNGRQLGGLPPYLITRAGVGRTFQVAEAYSSMTVREAVQAALLAVRGKAFRFFRPARSWFQEDANALLEKAGLPEMAERSCAQLAYGDVKRVELAMALAGNPRLLLMDEPTAGMAPGERQALMETISGLASSTGLAVLFTEHDMDVVFRHADRILVLVRGRFLAEGPPEEIARNPSVRSVYLGEPES